MVLGLRHLRHFRHFSNRASSFSTVHWIVNSPSPEVSMRCNDFGGTPLWPRLCSCPGMFRISAIETSLERRLVVEGTLTKPCVAELRKAWNEFGDSLDGRKMVIDLTSATIIDPEGEAAILELMQEGAKFSCSG